jgi:transposase
MLERYVLRLSQRLRGLSPQQSANFLRGTLTFPMPAIRHITSWVQRPARTLTARQRKFLTHLETVSPEVKETGELVHEFRSLMKHRQVSQFLRWLTRTEQSAVAELRSFAVGLRQEYASIAAAIEYPWSNGPVEGHVNRLKTIKRQMYGRANFDLLKAHVLYVSEKENR